MAEAEVIELPELETERVKRLQAEAQLLRQQLGKLDQKLTEKNDEFGQVLEKHLDEEDVDVELQDLEIDTSGDRVKLKLPAENQKPEESDEKDKT